LRLGLILKFTGFVFRKLDGAIKSRIPSRVKLFSGPVGVAGLDRQLAAWLHFG